MIESTRSSWTERLRPRRFGRSFLIILALGSIVAAGWHYGVGSFERPIAARGGAASDGVREAAKLPSPSTPGREPPSLEGAEAPRHGNVAISPPARASDGDGARAKLRAAVLQTIVSDRLAPLQLNLENWQCDGGSCLASMRMPVHASHVRGSPQDAAHEVLQQLQDMAGPDGATVSLSKLALTGQGTELTFAVADTASQRVRTLTDSEIAKLRIEAIREHDAQKQKLGIK